MDRAKVAVKEVGVSANHADPPVVFIPTGSTLLDLAIGGGWAAGRVFNIVGDKSTGKTLLAVEAFANFTRLFPTGRMRYVEAEAAFNDEYAQKLGFPTNVSRPPDMIETVEQFYNDLQEFSAKSGPSLYILDSLDALSDAAEMGNKFDNASTYGTAKAKQLSALFRRLIKPLSDNGCTLGIISQVRENIGVMFGEHYTRSGGKALDFYCSQIVWLSEVKKLKQTIKGEDRAKGVRIKAKCKKCKVGVPFREAEMDLIFDYGTDDEESMLNWLKTIKAMTKEEVEVQDKALAAGRDANDTLKLQEISRQLKQKTRMEWGILEKALAPKIRKYI